MNITRGPFLEEDRGSGSGQMVDLEALDEQLSGLSSSPDTAKGSLAALFISDSYTSQPNTAPSTSKGTPRTESEIVVRIDGMDVDSESTASVEGTLNQPENSITVMDQRDARLLGFQEKAGKSFGSSASAVSDLSELSSPPASPPSSKATTPTEPLTIHSTEMPHGVSKLPISEIAPLPPTPLETTIPQLPQSQTPSAKLPPSRFTKIIPSSRPKFDVRPRVSIPTDIAPHEYANQCIAAAESSRLNPYALHQEEYMMLREHISHTQVTTYLNIRNGILRLWLSNPQIGVAREEAIGCAKDPRWFDVANVCYEWLLRSGYINFGCAEVPSTGKRTKKSTGKKHRKTIVIIGAGLAGLGCARQLESLSLQFANKFQENGEEPPRIVVLEGRRRLGGRVYSRALDGSQCQQLAGFQGQRHSVECGGMIITGFDRGNPLNILVRGQMGLPYYALRPEMTMYDSNGKPVNYDRDILVEKLYNDCLERISDYKFKTPPSKLIEGNKDLMDEGKDSSSESQKTIAQAEEAAAALPQARPVAEQSLAPQVDLVPVSTDRTTGKTHTEPGTAATHKAAFKAQSMGWALKQGVDANHHDIELESAAQHPEATLGSLMDEAIWQYKTIVDLTAQDYRLMNWHIANLEYSNAANYTQLSLGGWDLDAGNEWEGKHTMVVGGYQNVPWGLSQAPFPLDIKTDRAVKTIIYDPENKSTAKLVTEDGKSIDADYVVSTIPLGVLKHNSVSFEPPLPTWKSDAIERLGYGILNKIILVFKEAFWDTSRDIFGILRDPPNRHSLKQAEYTKQRGRCFQWFDVSKTSGVPVLLALMAGDAGFDTEHSSNDELIQEATEVLRSVYGANKVPQPVQSVITRWGSDRFARGSYSSAGPNMRPDDYSTMAKNVGNLFFAGEHTTGTHPATVHGAYLSGLRVASELFDAMLGPIEIPVPLIPPKEPPTSASSSLPSSAQKRKVDASLPMSPRALKQARVEANEVAAWQHIVSQIGERPWRPQKVAANAYLLYSKTHFEDARKRCEEGRRPGKGKPAPNEVRIMTSRMWKEASLETKKPFEDQAAEIRQAYAERVKEWELQAKEWDAKALRVRKEWEDKKTVKIEDDSNASPAAPTGSDSGAGAGREIRVIKIDTSTESEGTDAEILDGEHGA